MKQSAWSIQCVHVYFLDQPTEFVISCIYKNMSNIWKTAIQKDTSDLEPCGIKYSRDLGKLRRFFPCVRRNVSSEKQLCINWCHYDVSPTDVFQNGCSWMMRPFVWIVPWAIRPLDELTPGWMKLPVDEVPHCRLLSGPCFATPIYRDGKWILTTTDVPQHHPILSPPVHGSPPRNLSRIMSMPYISPSIHGSE